MVTFSNAEANGETPDIDSSTDDYARRFSGSVGAWFLKTQVRLVLELLPRRPTALRILDVGGGHAQLAPHLIAAGHDVTVLGSAPSCGKRLQPWIDARTCRFHVGRLVSLPYLDREFDVVLCFRILAHVLRWERLIAGLCRVARQSVIVDYPSRFSVNLIGEQLFAWKKGIEGNTRPYRSYDHEEVHQAFAREAFPVTAVRPQFLLPMALHRLIGSGAASSALESPFRRLGVTQSFGSPVIARAERQRQIRVFRVLRPAAESLDTADRHPPST